MPFSFQHTRRVQKFRMKNRRERKQISMWCASAYFANLTGSKNSKHSGFEAEWWGFGDRSNSHTLTCSQQQEKKTTKKANRWKSKSWNEEWKPFCFIRLLMSNSTWSHRMAICVWVGGCASAYLYVHNQLLNNISHIGNLLSSANQRVFYVCVCAV